MRIVKHLVSAAKGGRFMTDAERASAEMRRLDELNRRLISGTARQLTTFSSVTHH